MDGQTDWKIGDRQTEGKKESERKKESPESQTDRTTDRQE